eukprot:4728440-Amphidinium_carterae.1
MMPHVKAISRFLQKMYPTHTHTIGSHLRGVVPGDGCSLMVVQDCQQAGRRDLQQQVLPTQPAHRRVPSRQSPFSHVVVCD